VMPVSPAIPLPTITVATPPDVPGFPVETAQATALLPPTLVVPPIPSPSPRQVHSARVRPGSAVPRFVLSTGGAAATFGAAPTQKRLRPATVDSKPTRHLPLPELPDVPNSSGAASAGGGLGLLLLAFFAALTAAVAFVPPSRSWLTWLIRDEPRIRPRAKERDRPG
jgi:hypothetical protein